MHRARLGRAVDDSTTPKTVRQGAPYGIRLMDLFDSTGGNTAGGTGEALVSVGNQRVFQQVTPDNTNKVFAADFE